MNHIFVVTNKWNYDTVGAFTTLDAAKRWVAGQYVQRGGCLNKPNQQLDTGYATTGEELEDTWGIAEFMYIEEVALMDV